MGFCPMVAAQLDAAQRVAWWGCGSAIAITIALSTQAAAIAMPAISLQTAVRSGSAADGIGSPDVSLLKSDDDDTPKGRTVGRGSRREAEQAQSHQKQIHQQQHRRTLPRRIPRKQTTMHPEPGLVD